MLYNSRRKHARNGVLSPADFERQQQQKLQGVKETRGYSDLVSILQLMTPECVLTVEKHGVKLSSHVEISAMFRRLWGNHQWVKHDQFN